MDLRKLIQEYLEEARFMQVATAKDNQPWVCTVAFAYDEDLTLYWISLPSTRHSQELTQNEKIAGTIVLPHEIGQKVRGIQFEGVARPADKEDMQKAMDAYATRMGTSPERKQSILDGKDGHVPYIITPTLFVLFDTLNFPDNPRQELAL